MSDVLTTQRDMWVKLDISHNFELTNCKISVYFNNIGLGQQLVEELMTQILRAENAHCLSLYENVCWGVCTMSNHVYFDK